MKIKDFMYIQGPTFIAGFLAIIVSINICDFNVSQTSSQVFQTQMNSNTTQLEEIALALEDITSEVVDVADIKYEGSIDIGSTRSYSNLLFGLYQIDDGYIMEFGRNGSYAGFYDKENTHVNNYSYEVLADTEKDEAYLYIFNPEQSEAVVYKLKMLQNRLCLVHKATGREIYLGK